MLREKVYFKKFSPIVDLQGAEEVQYSLVKKNNGEIDLYGIDIKTVDSKSEYHTTKYLSQDRDRVLDFMKYLYENSIRADVYEDIVNDFFCKVKK